MVKWSTWKGAWIYNKPIATELSVALTWNKKQNLSKPKDPGDDQAKCIKPDWNTKDDWKGIYKEARISLH